MKGVQRFDRRGKLTPRYIGLFLISERIGAISYWLDLPASMSSIHDVFHVSMLKKHLRDDEEQRVLDAPKIEIQEELTTIEIHVCILAKEDKKLRNKVIPLIKVQWNRRGAEETSWEREEDIRRDYPHLFEQDAEMLHMTRSHRTHHAEMLHMTWRHRLILHSMQRYRHHRM
ncbi:uncharacterized protein LOC109838713 [Asparagus officinalis]|uniref:uncharacterized protein LOC109838713 n=1 Tax=Asparagus officinalis TaxID=4686 RepID=UPI00098E4ED0|nr:uncharacterized protein LOC109838713 [Asparagus officinalis]